MPPLSVESSSSGSAPASFGPFRVLHQLGAGTLGPVFRAHDATEGRLVAIKTFRLDLTPERAADLARELEAVVGKRLTHPSIAPPIAAGLEGATPWLAQTYAPAESLDAVLRQYGPAPTAHVVTVVTHLAGALDFAAAAGVLHGSLHPRDVLVAPDETFLIDVGVAPALERCGIRPPIRRPYSAPERVAGGPVSRPSDIFALAAIAFELLLAQPIAGTDEDAGESLPDIHGADLNALKRLFATALSADPAARPDTGLTFASAFKTALGAASFRATPAVTARRPRRQTPTADQLLPLDEGPPADRGRTEEPAPAAAPAVTPVAAAAKVQSTPPSEPAAPGRISLNLSGPSDVRSVSPLDQASLHREPPPDTPSPRPTTPSGPTILSSAPIARPETRASLRTPLGAPLLAAFVILAVILGFGIGWLVMRPDRASTESAAVTPAERTESGKTPTPTETTGTATPRAETEHVIPETPTIVSEPAAVPPAAPKTTVAPPAAMQRPKPPEVVRGRLLVRSTPSGASVSINGRTRGETPLALSDLPLGGHTIVVSRTGYAPERRRVTLTRNRAAQTLTVPLRASATRTAGGQVANRPERSRDEGYTGMMVFESRPTGARVVLDGREVGRTPLVLPSIRAGSHVVRLELDGHRTWTASVQVVADERNRVAASLEELTR